MTKKELKAKQAFGGQLTPDQMNILNDDTYPDDYELSPFEAMTEAEQEASIISNMNKRGAQEAAKSQSNKIPTFYK